MEINSNSTTEAQMESCAVSTMRRMIEKYSDKTGIPFEDAFFPIYQFLHLYCSV